MYNCSEAAAVLSRRHHRLQYARQGCAIDPGCQVSVRSAKGKKSSIRHTSSARSAKTCWRALGRRKRSNFLAKNTWTRAVRQQGVSFHACGEFPPMLVLDVPSHFVRTEPSSHSSSSTAITKVPSPDCITTMVLQRNTARDRRGPIVTTVHCTKKMTTSIYYYINTRHTQSKRREFFT